MSGIIFDSNTDINFTYFLSILRHPYTFEEVVARLISLVDYDIFSMGDQYKISFEIIGKYKNQPFSLYDYKGDNQIHIGGRDDLDLEGFQSELLNSLANSKPKPFQATLYYDQCDGQTYSWP